MRTGIMKIAGCILVLGIMASCVSTKKYESLKKQCSEETSRLKKENQQLTVSKNEQGAEIEKLNKQIKALGDEKTSLNKDLKKAQNEYDELNQSYKQMLENNRKALEGNRTETQKILMELQLAQENLQKREDKLKSLEADLSKKQDELDKLSADLEQKETRLNELQTVLNQKDSVVNALKMKVSDALLGFEDKGLSVEVRNGKVYVSLEESLLFKTGSYTVGAKGVEVLKKLAGVLENSPDINVLIEGHTDNVPYNGSGQLKDNWDLSVMRATAVIKIIVSNSTVDPQRLIAAGRSEYVPLDPDDTPEARSKNRRTEIILTPKLDELFRIIESN